MGLACATAVAAGLASNRTLRCFDSTGCRFGGDAGRGVILEAALGHPGLLHLGVTLVDHSASMSMVRRGVTLEAVAEGIGSHHPEAERAGSARRSMRGARNKSRSRSRSRSPNRRARADPTMDRDRDHGTAGRGGARGASSASRENPGDPYREDDLYGLGGLQFGGAAQSGGPLPTEPTSGLDHLGRQLLGGTDHLMRAVEAGLDLGAAQAALADLQDRVLQDPAAFGGPPSACTGGKRTRRRAAGKRSMKAGVGGKKRASTKRLGEGVDSAARGASQMLGSCSAGGLLSLSLRGSQLDPVAFRDLVTIRRAAWELNRTLL